MKALVMGLGLHGGGLESARFLLKRGADVCVTDLRDEKTLSPSIEKLDSFVREIGAKPVRYILGKHEIEDFKNADMVIKNPGVRPDSPFLLASKRIETDLSLFLSMSPACLFAVTGTKGKSGTTCALHWILSKDRKSGKAYLGGNITVSPLTFLDELTNEDDVVLELSSFQLGDIKGKPFKPKGAILTSIMHDHLDRYATMDEYIDDKRNIYRGQDASCITVAGDDSWGKSFRAETKAKTLVWSQNKVLKEGISGGWIDEKSGCGFARLYNFEGASEEITELVPQKLLTPGVHQKINMLMASLASYGTGVKPDTIRRALADFKGIEHRLELFHENGGVRFYNDSAATIPEAAAACMEALTENASLVLVTGGTDKNLDFSPVAAIAKKAKAIILLAGTGSDKLKSILDGAGISYSGPFDNLDEAVKCAIGKASRGDNVALSPGCASFGMFLNEFDRGRKWKETVMRLG
ncbi:MAG: UDP-N-acetylmuramoyl-L-alanine--D-glutamate ligase [Treponema sp.]|nr:UDP-N-acetylmuramoyl-L-alanine--D-glutamate ligase [Treponema sp.]MCL2238114.1 UDP-N-acetylmuramoyl-L-alanine--D-glutamate ligase [Treponema sp.]